MRLPRRSALLAIGLLGPLAILYWQQRGEPAPQPVRKRAPARNARVGNPAAKPAEAVKVAPAPPERLADPPAIIRAVYYTGWSAGLRRRVDRLIELRHTTGLNALVFDAKDYSGYVSYRTGWSDAHRYKSVRVMIRDLDGLVTRLHQEGIYVIARITCFQDPVLARARPEWAVHRVSKLPPHAGIARPPLTDSTLWLDRKGLAWIDPAAQPAWDYLVGIARDLLTHGIDELNFDYVRFPSDGNLKDMYFPSWDGHTPKHRVIASFFAYLRKHLPGVPISADLFGLATVNEDDLGIGQVIEDAYRGFDAVCPMVYPSHFAREFLGYHNPAEHPYEVIEYSMRHARERLVALHRPEVKTAAATQEPDGDAPPVAAPRVKLRPWLQDFNLGARYTPEMVKTEIRAARDALGDRFAGYMLWSPSNNYTPAALE